MVADVVPTAQDAGHVLGSPVALHRLDATVPPGFWQHLQPLRVGDPVVETPVALEALSLRRDRAVLVAHGDDDLDRRIAKESTTCRTRGGLAKLRNSWLKTATPSPPLTPSARACHSSGGRVSEPRSSRRTPVAWASKVPPTY
jgi:hypothetical protein